jgi:hypothetical protein
MKDRKPKNTISLPSADQEAFIEWEVTEFERDRAQGAIIDIHLKHATQDAYVYSEWLPLYAIIKLRSELADLLQNKRTNAAFSTLAVTGVTLLVSTQENNLFQVEMNVIRQVSKKDERIYNITLNVSQATLLEFYKKIIIIEQTI